MNFKGLKDIQGVPIDMGITLSYSRSSMNIILIVYMKMPVMFSSVLISYSDNQKTMELENDIIAIHECI